MDRWMIVALFIAMVQVACTMADNAQLPSDGKRSQKYYCDKVAQPHKVTSEDGYITTTFRVPHNKTGRARGWPVLLQHSFGYNSDAWFHLGKNSLPCLLAAEGFDVWVASARGSKYSKGHTFLNADNVFKWPMYWTFSFHDMAVKDLPKIIDHILKTTKKNQLSYVGHGMGGTMIFILLSEKPKYNEKIKGSVTLVPTCFTSVDWETRFVAGGIVFLQRVLYEFYGMFCEIMENPPWRRPKNDNQTFFYETMKTLEYVLSRNKSQGRGRNKVYEVFGPDAKSTRTVVHLCQLIYYDKFRKYHLGSQFNLDVYGQGDPPTYQLQNVRTQQLILYSHMDEFINSEGARRLCSKLPRKKCEQVQVGSSRHEDFIKSKSAKQRVYDRVVQELRSYLPPIPTTTPPPENPECLVSR